MRDRDRRRRRYGHPADAPYDRIVVTAGAWELPRAWADQLAPGGLLVVPLRMRGLTRSVTFEHAAGIWRSRAMYECGFMPLRGVGGVAERNIPLGGTGITIRIDDGQAADATGDSFAYLTRRPGRPGHSELGACGYGPTREQLIGTYADRIRAFDRDRARAGRLRVEVRPAPHAPVPDAVMQIGKRSTRVIVRAEVP